MKVNCSGCNNEIRINRTQINQKLLKFYDKTKLYLCRSCRQKEGIHLDTEATIRKLEEEKSGIIFKFKSRDYEPTKRELGIKKIT